MCEDFWRSSLNAIAEYINFKFYESFNNEFESKLFKAKQIINKIQSNEMAKWSLETCV